MYCLCIPLRSLLENITPVSSYLDERSHGQFGQRRVMVSDHQFVLDPHKSRCTLSTLAHVSLQHFLVSLTVSVLLLLSWVLSKKCIGIAILYRESLFLDDHHCTVLSVQINSTERTDPDSGRGQAVDGPIFSVVPSIRTL